MKILGVSIYKDGGSVMVFTSNNKYCLDGRIKSNTINKLFLDYPDDYNTNIIYDSKNLKIEIIESLKKLNKTEYVYVIEKFEESLLYE